MEPLMSLIVIAFIISLIILCWQPAPILINVIISKGGSTERLTKWCNENWIAIRLQIFTALMRIYYAIFVSNDTLFSLFSIISIAPSLMYFVLDITLASNQINCILWWLPVPSCFVATVVCALNFLENETRERFDGWTFVSSTFFSSFCGAAIILYRKKVMAPYPFIMPLLQVVDGVISLVCVLMMHGNIYMKSSSIIGILAPFVLGLVHYYYRNSAIITSEKGGDAGNMVTVEMDKIMENSMNSIGTPTRESANTKVEKENNSTNSLGTPNAVVIKMDVDEANHSTNDLETSNEEEPARRGEDEMKNMDGTPLDESSNEEEPAKISGAEEKNIDSSLETSSSKEADMSEREDGTNSTKSPEISSEHELLEAAKIRMDAVETSNAEENLEMYIKRCDGLK